MNKIKYPRTLHLPWSEGMTNDDKMLPSIEIFEGKEVVVSLKLDGENSSIYSGGYTHARSLDSKFHISREWIRKFANDKHLNWHWVNISEFKNGCIIEV